MLKKQVIKKSAQLPVALVAGGAGFIGSYLVGELLEKKARVVVLDNFNTGKELHVKEYLSDPNFALYNVDINYGLPEDIESVDYIFHLAGVEEYLFSKEFINLQSLLTNSYGTKNLLDLAKKSEAKFLLGSSIDVYQGRMSQFDLAEYFGDTQEEITKFSLAEAKRYAEALVWEYFKAQDLDVRIVRLPEVFGPKMSLDSSGILGRFMKDLIEGRDITIYGDGYEKDYYLYITDAVSGLLKSLFTEDTKGKIYSLVTNEAISTLEVAFLLKGLADREMDIQFRPGKTSVRPKMIPPDTLNLRDINWKAKVGFKQGALKTLSWFGYAPNEYGFKPGKLIAKKKKKQLAIESENKVNTLQGLADKPVEEKEHPKEFDERKQQNQPEKTDSIAPSASVANKTSSVPIASDPLPSPSPPPPQVVPQIINAKKAPLLGARIKEKKRFSAAKETSEKLKNIFSSKYLLGFFGVLLAASLIFLIVPGYKFYKNLKEGLESLKTVPEAVYMFDAKLVSQRAELSYERLYKAKNSLQNIKWVFSLTGKKATLYSTDKMLSSLTHFSQAVYKTADVIAPFENLWSVILPDSETTLDVASFSKASSNLSIIKNHLKLAEVDFKYVDTSVFPESYSEDIKKYSEFMSFGLQEIDLVSSIVNELPEILGMGKEKKYIVWFQNSNEIRATGGFIGSYGVLEFSGGKLIGLTIDDIYNPDGQLDVRNIVVPPPKQVADYLAEDRLYLRNSNWDPDFPESAETFKNLYFKITGEEIDGVVAVDLDFTKGILDAIGPVFLTAYNEEISSENLYERTQYYAEFNYKDGSDQKRSFLTVLGSKLLEKLFSLEQSRIPNLLDQMGKLLNARDMLLYIPDLSISAYIKEKGWDGSIASADENYLFVVNSNLGGNKADYFIRPSMYFEVGSLTRDGLLRGTLELKYVHTGQDDAWPGGVYKDYIRVYSGLNSKLTSAEVVDSSGKRTDMVSDVAIYSDKNLTVFGYGIEVAPQETKSLILSFDLPQNFSISDDHKIFDLYWQKQSGTGGVPVELLFSPPFGLEVSEKSADLEESAKVVKYSGLLNEDRHFIIKFQ
ncbi:DUF4012 domain-containing protein [Patescibacteria group bacterium]|nr:DUF4012 domain-containing protein [Patescibacteria group bacterium]